MDLKTVNIRSTRFAKEFEVRAYDVSKGSCNYTIVSHDSLTDIIDNRLPKTYKELNARVTTISLLVSETLCVFQSTIADAFGNCMQEIGEARSATLAYQIAFDNAVIRYMNFPDNVVSCGKVIANLVAKPMTTNDEKGGHIDLSCVDDTAASPVASQSVRSETVSETTAQDPVCKQVSTPQQAPSAEKPKGPGDVVITIGGYRDKGMTVAQIYEESNGINFLKYVRALKPLKSVKPQIDAVTEFLASKGVN